MHMDVVPQAESNELVTINFIQLNNMNQVRCQLSHSVGTYVFLSSSAFLMIFKLKRANIKTGTKFLPITVINSKDYFIVVNSHFDLNTPQK